MPGKRSAGEAELHEVGWRSPHKKGLSTCPTRQQLNEALLSAMAHTNNFPRIQISFCRIEGFT